MARAAIRIPQIPILPFGGFRSPCVDSMERTKVPEFAEVTKKVMMRIIITVDIIVPNV